MPPLKKMEDGKNIVYIGIAADEPKRFHNLTERKKSPLVEAGWDEAYCWKWCEENDLLSPIYKTVMRGGVGSATIRALPPCGGSARATRTCGLLC